MTSIGLSLGNITCATLKDNHILLGGDNGKIGVWKASTTERKPDIDVSSSRPVTSLCMEGDFIVYGAGEKVGLLKFNGEEWKKQRGLKLYERVKHVIIKNGIVVGHDSSSVGILTYAITYKRNGGIVHSLTIHKDNIYVCVQNPSRPNEDAMIQMWDKYGNIIRKFKTDDSVSIDDTIFTFMGFDYNDKWIRSNEDNILISGNTIFTWDANKVRFGNSDIVYEYDNISHVAADGPYLVVVYKDDDEYVMDTKKIPDLLKGIVSVGDEYYPMDEETWTHDITDLADGIRSVYIETSEVFIMNSRISFVELYDNFKRKPIRLDTDMRYLNTNEIVGGDTLEVNEDFVLCFDKEQSACELLSWASDGNNGNVRWTSESDEFVTAIAMGRYFFIIAYENSLRLYDFEGTFFAYKYMDGDVSAMSLKGSLLCVAHSNKLEVFEVDEQRNKIGDVVSRFNGGEITSLIWRGDDIIGLSREKIHIVSKESEKFFTFLLEPTCMDAEGDRLVVGLSSFTNSEIAICSIRQEKVLQIVEHGASGIHSVSIQGHLFISADNDNVKLWDIDGKHTNKGWILEKLNSQIGSATLYGNEVIILYESWSMSRETLPPILLFNKLSYTETENIITVVSIGAGYIVTGHSNGSVIIWNPEYTSAGDLTFNRNISSNRHVKAVEYLAVGMDRAISAAERVLMICNLSDASMIGYPIDTYEDITGLAIDGNHFVVVLIDRVTTYDIFLGTEINTYESDQGGFITCIDYSNGWIVIGDQFGNITILDNELSVTQEITVSNDDLWDISLFGYSIFASDSNNTIYCINPQKDLIVPLEDKRNREKMEIHLEGGFVAKIEKQKYELLGTYNQKSVSLIRDRFLDVPTVSNLFASEGRTIIFCRDKKLLVYNWTPEASADISQDFLVVTTNEESVVLDGEEIRDSARRFNEMMMEESESELVKEKRKVEEELKRLERDSKSLNQRKERLEEWSKKLETLTLDEYNELIKQTYITGMKNCKNEMDMLLYEPWEADDFKNTLFLRFKTRDNRDETWCLTDKLYPADPEIPGDTDDFVSRDSYVDNMLYANWVERDGSPYTVDEREGVEGSPGSERYVRITSIFNGADRYLRLDDLLQSIVKIDGDGRTRDSTKIGLQLPSSWSYPIAVYCEYDKDIAIGNIRGDILAVSASHGNITVSVYKVIKIANFSHHDNIDTINECKGNCLKL